MPFKAKRARANDECGDKDPKQGRANRVNRANKVNRVNMTDGADPDDDQHGEDGINIDGSSDDGHQRTKQQDNN